MKPICEGKSWLIVFASISLWNFRTHSIKFRLLIGAHRLSDQLIELKKKL